MSIGTEAIARSAIEITCFSRFAREVRDKGIETEPYGDGAKVVGIRADYEPSQHWQEAVWNLYRSLHMSIQRILMTLYNDEHGSFDQGEVDAWLHAMKEHPFEPHGWVHRIIQLINHARRINGLPTDLGDPEFNLMFKVIRDRHQVSNHE